MTHRMPTLFLSHGSPMFAIEPGLVGDAWAKLGRTLPRPRAVLMVSAHWETAVPMLTGNPKPETIHDFGGFPPELYRLAYPAPGAPDLATQCVALLKAAEITAGRGRMSRARPRRVGPLALDVSGRGHSGRAIVGAAGLGTAHHVHMGRALAPLTRDGVLIIGSGHTTHNLRDWMANRRRPEPPRLRARVFHVARRRRLRRMTPKRWSPIANARLTQCARTRARSIFCRCSWPTARPANMPCRNSSSSRIENGALSMDSYIFGSSEATVHA